jgi:hypothetical protein
VSKIVGTKKKNIKFESTCVVSNCAEDILEVGVGIGRFRRKSEEIFFDRSDVGKVGNFTDFTDRNAFSTHTDTDTDCRCRSV